MSVGNLDSAGVSSVTSAIGRQSPRRIKPPRLAPGSTIGLVAPASPLTTIDADFVRRGEDRLRRLGFGVKLGRHVCDQHRNAAGTSQARAEDLMAMFEDPAVGAVMTVIGGYNGNELLEHLDYDVLASHAKVLIGFSDATALLNGLLARTGMVTFLGPAFVTFCAPELPMYTVESFTQVLTEPRSSWAAHPAPTFTEDEWFMHKHTDRREWQPNEGFKSLNHGSATGEAIGGNLDTLLALCGTEFFPDLRGRILFAEVAPHTDPRAVYRSFTQLRQMGAWRQLAGLVLGRFPSTVRFGDPEHRIDAMLAEILQGYSLPVLYDVDFGHTDPILTIPLGVRCQIGIAPSAIHFLEAGVV